MRGGYEGCFGPAAAAGFGPAGRIGVALDVAVAGGLGTVGGAGGVILLGLGPRTGPAGEQVPAGGVGKLLFSSFFTVVSVVVVVSSIFTVLSVAAKFSNPFGGGLGGAGSFGFAHAGGAFWSSHSK